MTKTARNWKLLVTIPKSNLSLRRSTWPGNSLWFFLDGEKWPFQMMLNPGCLIGILIMVYYNPHLTVLYNPRKIPTTTRFFFSLLKLTPVFFVGFATDLQQGGFRRRPFPASWAVCPQNVPQISGLGYDFPSFYLQFPPKKCAKKLPNVTSCWL